MMKTFLFPLLFLSLISCAQSTEKGNPAVIKKNTDSLQTAYFAAGCFWCVEAIFESIEGVSEVVSGYSGGTEKNPTYELVSSGRSKHAETVQIYYDSSIVSYDSLLVAFFGSHNPSTMNQQGPDFGPQYRSIIFYQNPREKEIAENYIQLLLTRKVFPKITTEVTPLDKFYEAEIYHQDYEKNNPYNPYVRNVSIPRLKSFQEKHSELLKGEKKQ